MAGQRRKRGLRYSAAQKQRILETARKLTGAQVKKRVGVSPLTFYRWRGPVRRRRASAGGNAMLDERRLREEARAGVRRVMPKILRQEVKAYLDALLRSR